MKFPWSKKEKSKEELEIERLELQAKLNDAKLRSSEVDESVMKANRIRRLFEELGKGAQDLEEVEQRLKMFAEQSGMEYESLRQEMRFKTQMKKLEEMDESALAKLEKLVKLDKQNKRLLGYK